ncbi:PepSY domain-containing protein [Methanobacterium sp. ACI-7]|uniref:PepSY domain-containing protein n=1 Tax=unclassified Methanobacterium TaxID=2627676 RepID=UPI0039C3D810
MDNKIIALIAVLFVVIAGGAYFIGTQNSNTPAVAVNNAINSSNSSIQGHTESKHQNHTQINNITKTKISAEQAKEIVTKFEQNAGFKGYTVALPTLLYKDPTGILLWHVGVYDDKGKFVWFVDVNAQTGEVYAQ